MPVEVREAGTDAEIEAAGRVTVAANAEFAPRDPDDPFMASWARYLKEMADAAARAAQGMLLVAVEDGQVVGTVTLYLGPGSLQWRPGDAMFRLRPRFDSWPGPGLDQSWSRFVIENGGQQHVEIGRVGQNFRFLADEFMS